MVHPKNFAIARSFFRSVKLDTATPGLYITRPAPPPPEEGGDGGGDATGFPEESAFHVAGPTTPSGESPRAN